MAPHSNTLISNNSNNSNNYQSFPVANNINTVVATTTSKNHLIEANSYYQQYSNSDSIYNHNPYDIYSNNINNSLLSPVSSNSGLDFININTNIEDISVLDMDITAISAIDWNQPQQEQPFHEQNQYLSYDTSYYEQPQHQQQQQHITSNQQPINYNNNIESYPTASTSSIIKNEPLYYDEDSITSATVTSACESNNSTIRSKQQKGTKCKKSSNELHYGPVVVRPRRNPGKSPEYIKRGKNVEIILIF